MSQLIAMFREGWELVGVPFTGMVLFALRPALLLVTIAAVGITALCALTLTFG
jgi:hypothetical protein